MKKFITTLLVCILTFYIIGCGETVNVVPQPIESNNISSIMEIKTEERGGCTITYHYKENEDNYYLFVEDDNFKNDNYTAMDYINGDGIKEIENNNNSVLIDDKLLDIFDNRVILKNDDEFNYCIRNRKELVSSGCKGFEENSVLEVFGGKIYPGDIIDLSELRLLRSTQSLLNNLDFKILFTNYFGKNELYYNTDKIVVCDYIIGLTSFTESNNLKNISLSFNYEGKLFGATLEKQMADINMRDNKWVDLSQFEYIIFSIDNGESIRLKNATISDGRLNSYGVLQTVVDEQVFRCRFLCGPFLDSFDFYFEQANKIDFSKLNGQTLIFEDIKEDN